MVVTVSGSWRQRARREDVLGVGHAGAEDTQEQTAAHAPATTLRSWEGDVNETHRTKPSTAAPQNEHGESERPRGDSRAPLCGGEPFSDLRGEHAEREQPQVEDGATPGSRISDVQKPEHHPEGETQKRRRQNRANGADATPENQGAETGGESAIDGDRPMRVIDLAALERIQS